MSLPNAITIARILAVPLVVWLIISAEYLLAFWLFVAAGVSDGIDGFIAKRFQQRTELGAYLDPLADKVLLVSIYLTLGFLKLLPAWLVILVASRDLLIVGAVLLSTLLNQPVKVEPLMTSKVNTVGQIILAGGVLGALGFGFADHDFLELGYYAVAILTVASGALYLIHWVAHMAANGRQQG